MRRFLLAGLALAWLAIVTLPVHARGQAPAPEPRALFDQATERLRSGRFAEARDLLARSLQLAPNPGTAFNLAVACRGTGEVLRALEVLDGLLADAQSSLRPEQRYEALRLRDAVRVEAGVIVLDAVGAPVIEVRVDGRPAGDLADGGRLEWRVDPGERLVVASAPDRAPAERRVRVARGARVNLRFELQPTPEARVGRLVIEAGRADEEIEAVGVARARGRLERVVPPGEYRVRLLLPEGARETMLNVPARSTVRFRFDTTAHASLWKSPIFWGAATVVVAGLVVGGALLLRPAHRDPVRDPVYGVVEALHAP